jgi:Flp pilus assembly protein TadG
MNRRGSALIEFAGSLILLSTLFAGIFQIGFTFYTYESLVNAVRSGARYASLQSNAENTISPEYAQSIRNLVVYGDPRPAAGARSIVPGLAPENIELVMSPVTATVSVRGFAIDSVFSKVKLDGRPTITFPVTGAPK